MTHAAASLALIIAWLSLTTACLAATWFTPTADFLTRLHLNGFGVALLALAVRLFPAVLLTLPQGSLVQWDINSYHISAQALLAGHDIYLSGRYPYLPLQIYLLAAGQWLNVHAGLPFLLLVKTPAMIADSGTAALLWFAARRRGLNPAASARIALLFALNPLSITVTALHGQFDAIPLFFAFAAWFVLDAEAQSRKGRSLRLLLVLAAGLLLGVGIADKSWPALILPALLWMLPDWRRRAVFFGAVAMPPAGSIIAYSLLTGVAPVPPLVAALGYQGFTGVWGISLLATKLRTIWPAVAPLVRFLDRHGGGVDLLAVLTAAVWLARPPDSARACLALILVAFAAASGWGFHWLIWLLPFAALVSERSVRVYTLLCAVEYVLIYFFFGGVAWGFTHFTHSLAILDYTWLFSLPVWLFIVAWATVELRATGPRLRRSVDQPRVERFTLPVR